MRRPENGFMWHWPERLLRAQAAVGFVVRRKRRARGAVVMGTTTTTMMIWNSEGSLPYFGFVLRTCGCGCGMRVSCVLCVFLWDGVRLVL